MRPQYFGPFSGLLTQVWLYIYYSENAICTYSHTEEGSNLAQPYGLTESL